MRGTCSSGRPRRSSSHESSSKDGRSSGSLAGVLIGLGLENKTSMAFLVIGLGAGVLLTRERRWLRSPLPVDRGRHCRGNRGAAHHLADGKRMADDRVHPQRGCIEERAVDAAAVRGQPVAGDASASTRCCCLPACGSSSPLTADGFACSAWAYVTIFLVIFLQHGKTYYLSPSYPLMFAGGSVAVMRVLRARAGRSEAGRDRRRS